MPRLLYPLIPIHLSFSHKVKAQNRREQRNKKKKNQQNTCTMAIIEIILFIGETQIQSTKNVQGAETNMKKIRVRVRVRVLRWVRTVC